LAVWVTIVSVQMPLSMLLNGAGVVRFQVVAASCMALANLALSITLAHSIGISGPVWGSVVAYLVCTGVPSVLYLRYRFTWRSDHPTQWVT
jgi:O-antigen/teichoic acid export membrane protein